MFNVKERKKEIVLAAVACVVASVASVLTANFSPAYYGRICIDGILYDFNLISEATIQGFNAEWDFKDDTLSIKEQIDGMPVVEMYLQAKFLYRDNDDGIDLRNQITSLSIPDEVQILCLDDFYELESIDIPDGVTSLRLNNCKSLTDIDLPDGVTKIDLKGCESLTSIEIPDGVTDCDFEGCESLTSVIIPHSTHVIGIEDFLNCRMLKSVEIPEGVWAIDSRAFEGCSSLTKVILPDSIEHITSNAFDGCDSLVSVSVPSGLKIPEDCSWIDKVVYR